MKKILTVAIVMSICVSSLGQHKRDSVTMVLIPIKEYDSLKSVSAAYKDTADAFFSLLASFEMNANDAKMEAQTLQYINDSLVTKINKMLIFHYYACQIIQAVNSDGSIRSRKNLIKAVNQYHNYYKNKHE